MLLHAESRWVCAACPIKVGKNTGQTDGRQTETLRFPASVITAEMFYGWEGNRRSGVLVAMRYNGLRTGDEQTAYTALRRMLCLVVFSRWRHQSAAAPRGSAYCGRGEEKRRSLLSSTRLPCYVSRGSGCKVLWWVSVSSAIFRVA